jgi:hypothetical protein
MFWYLYLAHLLGDYPFQPNWMVVNKRHAWALLLHGAIHFLFMFVLVGQARFQLLPQLLTLTTAHVILDALKYTGSEKRGLSVQSAYLIDQGIHIVLVLLTAFWIERSVAGQLVPSSWHWSVIATAYVFITYAWATTERLLTENSAQYNQEVVSQAGPRMIVRAVLLTLALYLVDRQVYLVFLAAVSLPYISGKYRRRALITDIAVTVLTTLFVLLVIR